MLVVKLGSFPPQCIVGIKSQCGFKSIPSSSLFKEERDRVINTLRSPFQKADDCKLGVCFVQFLPSSWSVYFDWCQKIHRDIRDWSLGCTKSENKLVHWPSTLPQRLEHRPFFYHCCVFKTRRMWPRKQSNDLRLSCAFLLFLLFPRTCVCLAVLQPLTSKFSFLPLQDHHLQPLAVWGFYYHALHKKGRMTTKPANS